MNHHYRNGRGRRVIRSGICAAALGSVAFLLPVNGVAQQQLPPDTASAGSATLQSVVKQAITSNPEVQAAWNGFQAAGHDAEAASGGFLPQLDVTAGVGIEDRENDR
ncbi:TolC family protein, partial [Halomonas halmophila]|uniref:TolC family protein n=1 Tax=Halomonas halmophila TaxID=252 RepID=UPI0014778483